MKNKPPKICPCCGYSRNKWLGNHSPTCRVAKWETITKQQAEATKHAKKHEELKNHAMIEDYYLKKKIGPPTSTNSAKKAKSHSNSNWPKIISGGAVERNRHRH